MVIHDGTKPYLCRLQDCGKSSDKTFSQLGNLKVCYFYSLHPLEVLASPYFLRLSSEKANRHNLVPSEQVSRRLHSRAHCKVRSSQTWRLCGARRPGALGLLCGSLQELKQGHQGPGRGSTGQESQFQHISHSRDGNLSGRLRDVWLRKYDQP